MHQTFPRMFGKYILEGELARGGMAAVFKATLRGAEGFEKRLVVKQILPEFARDSELIQRFIAEAKLLVELNHANIVRVFELGVERGTYFIAMEYVDGRSLHQLLRGAPFSLSEIVLVAASIAKALAYAHKRGIVHRDLTPRNVLIDREGHVFLIDFGLASRVASTDALDYGTEGYAAPEQIENAGQVEPSADIYSLGKIIERLSLHADPHHGLSQLSQLASQATMRSPTDRMDAVSIEKALRNLPSGGGAEERLAARVEASALEVSSKEGPFTPVVSQRVDPTRSPSTDSGGLDAPSEESGDPHAGDASAKTASFAKRTLDHDQPSTRKLPPSVANDDPSSVAAQREVASRSASTRSIFVTMGVFAVLLPLVPIGFVLSGATRSDAGVDPVLRSGTTSASSPAPAIPSSTASSLASSSSPSDQTTLPPRASASQPDPKPVPSPSVASPIGLPRSTAKGDAGANPSGTTSVSNQTTAFVDLFGEPGTRFRLNGVVLGGAPIRHHTIAGGTHRVEATFEPTGESLSESITVHSDETLRIIAKFRSPVPTLTVERQ